MSEEPIVTQLKAMIDFLKKDIEVDEISLKNPRNNWYVRFIIRRQIRITRKQINHYLDKIDKYESDAFD